MSHLNTRMPSGDDVIQRSDPKPAFSDDLFERALRPENLQAAWKHVRANKGAAGVDGMTIDEFPGWVTRLGQKVRDKRLLKLIQRYLRAGILDKPQYIESRIGVSQSGPLSPLLANIMLDPLDKELEARGHLFARYADDFTILVKSRRAGERVLRSLREYLQNRLKRVVNMTKRMHYQLFRISQYVRGWINYFGIANGYQQCVELDHWIRRRVRMAYWRQWRRPRTKVRNLMKLGVPVQSAVACGITSSKSRRF